MKNNERLKQESEMLEKELQRLDKKFDDMIKGEEESLAKIERQKKSEEERVKKEKEDFLLNEVVVKGEAKQEPLPQISNKENSDPNTKLKPTLENLPKNHKENVYINDSNNDVWEILSSKSEENVNIEVDGNFKDNVIISDYFK